jgi:hypothetical protein
MNPFFDWVASASRFVDFDVPTAADLNAPLDEVTAGFDAVDVVLDDIATDLAGLSSPVQTQLDGKADITGETYTGTHNFTGATAVSVPAPSSGAHAVTKTYVDGLSFAATLPDQTGNGGKVVGTDGATASWIDALKATVMRFVDGSDATKKLAFDVSGVSTATTRTLTVPNADGTIALLGNSASQAQMEEGTNIYTFATPANVQWHQSAAKAWIKCDAAGAISASYNVTSITDGGAGNLTVTIANDFSSANYAVVGIAQNSSGNVNVVYIVNASQAAGSFQAQSIATNTGSPTDADAYYFVCFGDLA